MSELLFRGLGRRGGAAASGVGAGGAAASGGGDSRKPSAGDGGGGRRSARPGTRPVFALFGDVAEDGRDAPTLFEARRAIGEAIQLATDRRQLFLERVETLLQPIVLPLFLLYLHRSNCRCATKYSTSKCREKISRFFIFRDLFLKYFTKFLIFIITKLKVVYREPVTGSQSQGMVHRKSAINNKLAPKPAPKPTPKPNSNPTLTLP